MKRSERLHDAGIDTWDEDKQSRLPAAHRTTEDEEREELELDKLEDAAHREHDER